MIRRRNMARALKKAVRDPGYAAAAFRKRLGAYMMYRFGSGRSVMPETVSLFLTYRCNLRCTMCGQWGEHGWARDLTEEEIGKHIPLDRIETLMDELAKYHPAITLFGGEPFLHPEWEAIAHAAKSRGMRVNVITNGVLVGTHAERIIASGIDELIFSLDGPENVHDTMRGGEGVFRRAMESFRNVNELKRKSNSRTPRINISTAIFETNYRRLGEVIDAAESIGADSVTLHHLIFHSPAVCDRHNTVMYAEFGVEDPNWRGFARDTLPDIDTDKLIRSLHDLRRRQSGTAVTVYPNFTDDEIRRYYGSFEFIPSSYARRCLSPWMTAYIFPNGDVKPCLDTGYVAGNIMSEGFAGIWNGEKFRRYRQVLKRRGCFPACTRCTEFYRA